MNDTIDEGGFAFPCPTVVWENANYGQQIETGSEGMSRRDWLAGLAMQGMLAASGDADGVVHFADLAVAESAYQMADAMIAVGGERKES